MGRPVPAQVPASDTPAGDQLVVGGVYYDPDYGRYMVRLSAMMARTATSEEVKEYRRSTAPTGGSVTPFKRPQGRQ